MWEGATGGVDQHPKRAVCLADAAFVSLTRLPALPRLLHAHPQGTVFEHIFGGGGRVRRRPMIRTAMRISFEEAVRGTSRTVDLSQLGMVGMPSKTVELNVPPGGRQGAASGFCAVCIVLPQAAASLRYCPTFRCSALPCRHSPHHSTHRSPPLSLPPWRAAAGVDSGFQLRLEGVMPGGPQGMPPGDLIVQIEVMPSPVFRREDFDLYVDVPVSMVDACLGTSIE